MPYRAPRSLEGATSIPPAIRRALDVAARVVFEVDEERLSPPRRALVFLARLVWLTVRGFFHDRLQIRAASLAFATLLAIVPVAALAFAIADALGATDLLVAETIEPFLDDAFGRPGDEALPEGARALRGTLDGLVALVRSTHVAGLGVAGSVLVLFAILRVVTGVEEALEHVFQHRGPRRTLWRRARAFAVVALTTPIGLSYAVVTAVITHDTALGRWVALALPFAPLRELLLSVLPPVIVALTLLVLYVELPDAEVRKGSALLGAALAAVAWYGLQLLHIRFQVGLARWNAIYSGFGAFPMLLLSIHLSWVMVLLGAQIVAAHQNAPSLRQLARGTLRDHAERQALAVRAAIALARRDEPAGLRALASELGVGVRPLRDVLDALAAHGLARLAVDRSDRRYALAVQPETLRASTILDALERSAEGPDLPWEEGDEPIRALLSARRAAASSSGADRTIAELAGPSPGDATAAEATTAEPDAADDCAADPLRATDPRA